MNEEDPHFLVPYIYLAAQNFVRILRRAAGLRETKYTAPVA